MFREETDCNIIKNKSKNFTTARSFLCCLVGIGSFANVKLGVNQGLAWSMTVNMKIDLVRIEKRGLALGLNEFAGYISVALIGFLTGYVAAAYGLKPYPFYLGFAVSLLGLIISLVLVKDTSRFTQLELQQEKDGQLKREQLKNQEEGHESSKIREESTVEKSEVISFLLIIVFLLRL